MTALKLFTPICVALTILFSCKASGESGTSGNTKAIKGNKHYIEESRTPGDIKSIYATGSMNIEYSTGNTSSVHIYGESNIIPLLEIKNEEGELYIGFKSNTSVSFHKLKIRIQSPVIDKIKMKGSGSFDIPEPISVKNLKAGIEGSGNIDIKNITIDEKLEAYVLGSGNINIRNIRAEKIEADVRGSGNIRLAGSVQKAEYKISGSGNINAGELKAGKAKVEIKGSGYIQCDTDKEIEGHINGSGYVRYKGNPAVNNIKIHGSGRVSSF